MRILLLRHAKSAWDNPGLLDHDRPLAERGLRAASAMGRHFAGSDLRIDWIVSSTAERACRTAGLFRDAFDPQIRLTRRSDLYHADSSHLLRIALEEAGDSDEASIMLVGHNPGMHDLAVRLCGEGEPSQLSRLQVKFPTAALAEFDLSIEAMMDGRQATGRLLRYVRPKDLPGVG